MPTAPRCSTLLALFASAACASSPTSSAPVEVDRLELSLAAGQLVAGRPTPVIVKAFDASGLPIESGRYPITWMVDDSLASVAGGVLVSKVVSTFVLRATSGSASAALTVSVVPAAPALTRIVLDRPLAKVGDEAMVTGFITDQFGNAIRDAPVYCSCQSDASVANRIRPTTIRVVARGQFALLIAGEQYGVADSRLNFDIRE